MHLLKRFKNEIVLVLLLSAFYFLLRLIFLDRLPIFTDEAIYIRWAQIALHDSSWRFISLTDGKQPMFVWAAIVFMKFIHDPLIASRLVSVVCGFFTMLGLWAVTYELFKNKTTSFLVSALYIFYPFAQVLDRMALYDSMVATFYIWAFYFSILLVRKVKLDIAYTLGVIIGLGVLTKTTNFFNIYLLPFTIVLFNLKDKFLVRRLFRFIILAIFAAVIGYGIYNILRLSPLFSMISAKNAVFVYPLKEWINHPFTFFEGNLHGLLSWLLQYLTIPYILLIVVSIANFRHFAKEKLLLITYFLLPFVALALFGKVIFPRFVFFMSLSLIVLAADGLNLVIETVFSKVKLNLPKYSFAALILLVFVLYPGFVSFQFAQNPITAKIADADSRQYINSWSAGWGVKESINFFENQAKDQKIFVATEGTFGLMPESYEMYLGTNKNIKVKGYWPVDIFPPEVLAMAKKMPTYFVFYQPQHVVLPATYPPMKLIFEVRQGNTNTYFRVYQVTYP